MNKNTTLQRVNVFNPFTRIFLLVIYGSLSFLSAEGQNCSPDIDPPNVISSPSNVIIECTGDVPPIIDPVFSDDCDNNLEIFFSEVSPASEPICTLSDSPVGAAPGVWSVLLNGLPGGLTDKWILDPDYPNNRFEEFPDGTGYLSGKVLADNDPNKWFIIDVIVTDKRDWPTWSSLLTTDGFTNRTAKDDAGHAAALGGTWVNWDFYEIDETHANLVGGGELAGTYLELIHAPSNFLFGFQVGLAANDRTPAFGLSSWFTFTGFINNGGTVQSFSGLGDFNMEIDCNPPFPLNQCGVNIFDRYWVAVDDVGNATMVNQVITVEAPSPPIFSNCPSNISVNCDDIPAIPGNVTAVKSNCDGDAADVMFSQTVNGDPLCPNSIVRTWSAEFCEPAQCMQVITVVDDCECDPPPGVFGDKEPPELMVPNDVTIECDQAIPDPFWLAEDNCDNDVEVTVSASINDSSCGGADYTYTMTRTYYAVDDCGNSTTKYQYIYVVDTTAPVITGSDYSISCSDDINALPAPAATDNCDSFVTTVLVGETTTKGDCVWNFTKTRTWAATDDCGNTGYFTQTVTVSDTEGPYINVYALNQVVDCYDVPYPPDYVSAHDYCDDDYYYIYSNDDDCSDGICFTETIVPGECDDEYTIIWTWTATDECGNVSTVTQTYNVTDNNDPYWSYFPWDMYIECDDDIPAPNAQAADYCDPYVNVTYNETVDYGDCLGEQTITRVYTATDNCGNSISNTQHITVLDITPPYISVYEPVVFVPIGGSLPGWDSYYVWDNCDPEPYVVISDDGQPINCVENEIVRTYTAFDDCGNSSSVQQLIYVKYEDEVPPVAKCHNITRSLDSGGWVYIDVDDIDGEWYWFGPDIGYDWYYSYDNCEISNMWLSQNWFSCYNVGVNEVTLYVEDFSKNISTCTAYVTIEDNSSPYVVCEDYVDLYLNSDGLAFLSVDDAIYDYYDNCGIADLNVSPGIFNATSLGDPNLEATVTVTDVNGNVSTCTVDVNLYSGVDPCDLPYFVSPPWGTYEDFSLNYLHLNWAEYLNANACKILGNKVGASWNKLITVGNINTSGAPNHKSIQLQWLNPNTQYRWKIRCGCSNNPNIWSPYNDYQYFTTPPQAWYDANGIEVDHKNQFFGNDDIQATLDIYPNPNYGEFTINTSLTMYNIEITDVTGKVVYSLQNVNQSKFQIELPEIANGIYQLSIFNDSAIRTEKILIREL